MSLPNIRFLLPPYFDHDGAPLLEGLDFITKKFPIGYLTDGLSSSSFSFNRIDVPPYESYEKFLDKLTCAVEETCGFTVE